MHVHGNVKKPTRKRNGRTGKSARGYHELWPIAADERNRAKKSSDNARDVHNIFPRNVPPQLA
ncbi:MAG: hypothetical protein COT39_01620 [Parcubacteria group bacterium CG08_land_8_20_14_0_20_48_21]|nr:MAG: hypothetical protein COT39_01620 [Parcubacteria group bacterium CG08_land_8_20_14_0_20_48_21]PIY77719.1 MAG: hypothetical protein COY83_03650 [Parcubacteria group bacterium CG_4_10_14_0_8_um_filter_48_154]PJC39751.1 MAG: hypothetical protein CO043_02500 [Parcubacteria group bacterium CG_4_9_14_0_2_um_filter_48_40]PJE52522.1 MAG: hypothetical protein COV80_03490 [Parcubacteria group bacterium CG11_big_fil_rev_8_21_14_0_20_48_46]